MSEPALEGLARGLTEGPGARDRTVLVTAAHQSDRVALLEAARRLAAGHGWQTVDLVAAPGMLDTLAGALEQAAALHAGALPASAGAAGFRYRSTHALDALARAGTRLLLAVECADLSVIGLVHEYQHWVSDGRDVALVLAGSPAGVGDLLDAPTVGFLHRASRHDLP